MNPTDASTLLRQAAAHHQHGELASAEVLYRKLLEILPDQSAVLHLLGVLLGQTDRLEESLAMLERAVTASPGVAMYRNDLGNALRNAGRLNEAIASFAAAVELDPTSVSATANLGNALGDAGRFDEAVAACRRAVELAPDVAAVHSDLGVALAQLHHWDQSIAEHERAIALDPNTTAFWNNYFTALRKAGRVQESEAAAGHAVELDVRSPVALNNLAICRLDAGDTDPAISLLRSAIRIDPDYADAHNNLGNALCAAGQAGAGEVEVREAMKLRPNFADAHTNLSTALREQGRLTDALDAADVAVRLDSKSSTGHTNRGACLADNARFEEAVDAFERAIALDPESVAAHTNLAAAYAALGMKDRCLAAARRAVEIDPSHAAAHTNLGLMLLTFGEFAQGWAENEWRWAANTKSRRREFPQPQWDGSPLHGRTILLHAEQGFGDGIQFMRYAPLVAARGGQVILEVAPALARLAKTLAGVDTVIAYGEPLPAFDVQCPLMSLPLAIGTIPSTVPYLSATDECKSFWSARLGELKGFRIGLVWAGRATHSNDRNRSMPFERLRPLFAVPGISWVSLQQQPASIASSGENILNLGDELHDFADTAGLLGNLDGLVSVDSAVAHLAGAMAVPTWLMLPRVADWRWMIDRVDSDWYPQHRLVRQRVSGEWVPVVEAICKTLRDLPQPPVLP